MTPKERAAIQHALEAIGDAVNQALATIQAAIAKQAEQEPVHVENIYKRGDKYFAWICDDYVQIYTAPVRTKDLTDEEITTIGCAIYGDTSVPEVAQIRIEFARAVIASDREKNRG